MKIRALSDTLSLMASSSTLLCCALPSLFVALGAGASFASLITWFPQLIWLSEHKVGVFLFATIMLLVSTLLQYNSRNASCPTDPHLRDACMRSRKRARITFMISGCLYLIGGFFTFILPHLY